ncbi:MAG: hypothetical protein H6841_08645 [Planctomycetes bacterium]|nr:hypothetical protein [Planctomycetota bacterium]MCB9934828.1 hypothetical protein [Planctomycetota bacterium]MCG3184866.1 hypothetical protein [Planctomycetota bacterium]
MGIFKSKEERRIARDMEIKKGIQRIRRQIKELGNSEAEWLEKARQAARIKANDQLAFVRKSLKATTFQRRMLERQLLTIEAAYQMKNQAESFATFAESMGVVSKSINEVYKTTDLEATQKNFEHAMMQAETMSQRMDLFLDMSKDSLFETDSVAGEQLVTDDEIDQMIGVSTEERKKLTREELDREIARELGEDVEKDEAK